MKTIKLLDNEYSIKNEYDTAVCVWETYGTKVHDFTDVVIKLGQKVYNVKTLETGSIVFTITPDPKNYIVTMFPQMFGFLSDEQLNEINELKTVILECEKKINEIYGSIVRAGYTDIP